MGAQPFTAWLRSVRRLRRGSIGPADAVTDLKPFLENGLGYTCDVFAGWISGAATNGRAADAAIRFYGLDRLPEDLDRIGATMRARRDRWSPLESPLGISARQVQKLITEVLDELGGYPPPRPRANAVVSGAHTDPFATPIDPIQLRELERILWWAWAQVPDGDPMATSALLLYEQEHGLRDRAVTPNSRMERLRLRRLAWSMLDVARYRADLAGPTGNAVVERGLGRTYLVEIDTDPLQANREQLAALMSLSTTGPTSLDAVTASMDLVRAAVRTARPEATELLGILNDAIRRYRLTAATKSTPMEIVSKLFALSTILARERRDIAGLARGHIALQLIDEWLESPAGRHNPQCRAIVVSDSLRINQELAELYDAIGSFDDAWRTLGQLRRRLDRLGDPEQEFEPNGWLQQLRLTESSVARHLSASQDRSPRWLQRAAFAADQAAALALDTEELPLVWGIAATSQRIGVSLDKFERSPMAEGVLLLRDIDRRLAELDRQAARLPRPATRTDLSTILGIKLTMWRAAILRRDRAATIAAQQTTLAMLNPRTLPREIDEIEYYVQQGRRLGMPDGSAAVMATLRRQIPDRVLLRLPIGSATRGAAAG
jgi:hypothetical protein